MRFADLSLVFQMVTALIAAWVTIVILAIWIVDVVELRRRRRPMRLALRALVSLAPIWIVAEGYVAAIAKWFSVRNDLSLISIFEMIWALFPVLNILYAWNWLLAILAFNGKFIMALFGFPGGW